jgi:hypothetical protein
MVAVAASIAQAASTAFPPCWKTIAPAVAPRGLPVIATQWRPWSTGLAVCWASRFMDAPAARRQSANGTVAPMP